MSAPRTFLVKECAFSKFAPTSEIAPVRLPDSSPALVMDTKSLEKTFGNFAKPEDNVPPALTSWERATKILLKFCFFVCFSRTDNARESESPARSIPLKFLVKRINSTIPTLLKKLLRKTIRSKERLLFFSVIETGVSSRDLNSRERAKRFADSKTPSINIPFFDFAL